MKQKEKSEQKRREDIRILHDLVADWLSARMKIASLIGLSYGKVRHEVYEDLERTKEKGMREKYRKYGFDDLGEHVSRQRPGMKG